ncbi:MULTISPECIES: hypothetical protein [Methylobacterium]|uniref:Uncharacterized protein n=1 Tax=Methylobacterium bullatum TaxID=570505 RepID=A0A679KCE4_9HYPH|nr:hypothetical protein [Methylobacterium sp. WL19]TXN25843.1 hypothetical protein FV220_17300 [Methylobacterium sp. WL19]CAA2144825.1 hypothetical protein MBLL_03946 [Methylobacterium bullatum]
MTLRSLITAAALATVTVTVGVATLPASAETIKPLDGGSVSLGELSGVAYYTAEPKGYRVVVTLARTGTSRAMRFETVLANGQSVTLSTPQELGGTADAIEISRTGDTVAVNRPRPGVTREAAAQN